MAEKGLSYDELVLGGTRRHFATSARETQGHATLAQDMSFSSLVKVDHVIFKQRAYMTLNTSDESYANAVTVDHHNCRLGNGTKTKAAGCSAACLPTKTWKGRVPGSTTAFTPCCPTSARVGKRT